MTLLHLVYRHFQHYGMNLSLNTLNLPSNYPLAVTR